MSGIVLVLGHANAHTQLIREEMQRVVGHTTIVRVHGVQGFHESRIAKTCQAAGEDVIAYVLPPDGTSSSLGETDRDHWKALAEKRLPSRSVKELEICPFACGNGKFWLDGVDQFSSRTVDA